MRELRFRAWDGVKMWTPEMLGMNAYLLEPSGKGVFHLDRHDCRDKGALLSDWQKPERGFTLMQYTGLLGKNGNRIFEGDIVERVYGYTESNNPRMVKSQIVFEDGRYKFYRESDMGKHYTDCYSGHKVFPWQVIGNIYENPELLEGEK